MVNLFADDSSVSSLCINISRTHNNTRQPFDKTLNVYALVHFEEVQHALSVHWLSLTGGTT